MTAPIEQDANTGTRVTAPNGTAVYLHATDEPEEHLWWSDTPQASHDIGDGYVVSHPTARACQYCDKGITS